MIHHKAFSNAPTPTQDWSIQTLSRDSILILKCHHTLAGRFRHGVLPASG
jgi:hypothetical protein